MWKVTTALTDRGLCVKIKEIICRRHHLFLLMLLESSRYVRNKETGVHKVNDYVMRNTNYKRHGGMGIFTQYFYGGLHL